MSIDLFSFILGNLVGSIITFLIIYLIFYIKALKD